MPSIIAVAELDTSSTVLDREPALDNSGDTSGPRDQVVGYGAFVFEEAAT